MILESFVFIFCHPATPLFFDPIQELIRLGAIMVRLYQIIVAIIQIQCSDHGIKANPVNVDVRDMLCFRDTFYPF